MKTYTYKKGAAVLIVVLFFVVLSVTILIGISMPIAQQIENATDFLTSKNTYNVADMQAENAMYRLNKGKTDAPSVLSLLGYQATGVLADVGSEKQISIQGLSTEFERYVIARFKQDTGVAFSYGLQTGTGGLQMSGSSYIVGNVYSNGDITGNGGSGWYTTYITGSATAANVTNPTPQIQNLSSTPPAYTQDVGITNTNQDFAQSFTVSTTSPITEVDIFMKKTGTPANATVSIVNNNAGVPGSTVLTSGVLSSALATSLYSYVPVTMTANTNLVSGATYWIVVDMPANSTTNYYTLGMNNNSFNGTAKQGISGTSWINLSNTTIDAGFSILVGGDSGLISGMGVGTSGTGDAWAKVVNNTTVRGSLFCQVGTGNSKTCDTTKADPVAAQTTISTGNLDEWKATATTGGSTTTVSLGGTTVKTIGPMKINGNLTVDNSAILKLTGTIYVTGNVTVSGSGKIYVDSSLGANSAIIVTDGRIDLNGSGGVYGSGTVGSYVVMATGSTCPVGCGTSPAISISGAAGSVIVAAPNGTVNFSGSAGVKSVVAKTMVMSGTTYITYDSGLTNLSFSSGPSGQWAVSSWKESLGL